MAIAQLTHLHISIPASGAPPGAVPEDCFPSVSLSWVSAEYRQVSFASAITVLGAEPDSEQSPERVPVDRPTIQIHDPVCPDIPEEDDMDDSGEISFVPEAVLPPPPGFEQFSWLTAVGQGGDPSLFDFSAELPKWLHGGWAGQSRDPPALSISPILNDTPDDSLVTNVGSSRDEPDMPSVTDLSGLSHKLCCSPASGSCPSLVAGPGGPVSLGALVIVDSLLRGWLCFPEYDVSTIGLRHADWRIWCSDASSSVFGMDWPAGVCQSVGNVIGMWLNSLSRDQSLDAALQLHKDVCLMTTNLDILEQYVSCLQGTASKILELGLGPRGFPSEEAAAGAMGPRVRRASIQMEAIGLWRPSLDPLLIP